MFQSIRLQLSITRRVIFAVLSSCSPALVSLFRYRSSSVCKVAGRTQTARGAPPANVTPVRDVSPARKVSSLVLLERSIPVKEEDLSPDMSSCRRLRQLPTRRALSVICPASQLTFSSRKAVQLFRFNVPTMAWATSVRSSPRIRLAP